MTEQRVRPTFDDPLVTETPAALTTAHHGPDGDSRPLTIVPPAPLTPEEAAVASRAIFEPTLRRMAILVQTLIQVSENGDFALWAPLGCLDQVLRGLDWSSVPRESVIRFYTLIQTSLANYAMTLDGHIQQLRDLAVADPLPALTEWTGDDTVKMYDLVDAMFRVPTPDGTDGTATS